MCRLGPILAGFLMAASCLPGYAGQGMPADVSHSFVSRISPDLSVVTEVSLTNPYVGQQFSIVYKLRAQRPPAAVDIDPQQYSGFWTEMVPISQDSTSSPRVLKGQAAVDFLLRQVIAYPLLEGRQELPPLSLKIKRASSTPDRRDDWDLLGASAPVDIEVMPLPPAPQTLRGTALVGKVSGEMSWQEEGHQTLLLEMQGTANLALFNLRDWIRPTAGAQIREQLLSADRQTQTVDIEGKRQLSLLQRQRWLIRIAVSEQAQPLTGFSLPVFEPREKLWRNARIEGPSVLAVEPQIPGSNSAGKRAPEPVGKLSRMPLSQVLIVVIGATCLVTMPVWILWRRRKGVRSQSGGEATIAALEKKLRTSPRAFLDGAHKVLARCAVDLQRQHNLGAEETLLDRCWIAVQKRRFTVEPLTRDACEEVLQSIKKLLLSPRDQE